MRQAFLLEAAQKGFGGALQGASRTLQEVRKGMERARSGNPIELRIECNIFC